MFIDLWITSEVGNLVLIYISSFFKDYSFPTATTVIINVHFSITCLLLSYSSPPTTLSLIQVTHCKFVPETMCLVWGRGHMVWVACVYVSACVCVWGRECVNGKAAVWALVGGCSVQCPPKLKPGGLPFTNGIPWRYSWNFIMWPEPTLSFITLPPNHSPPLPYPWVIPYHTSSPCDVLHR